MKQNADINIVLSIIRATPSNITFQSAKLEKSLALGGSSFLVRLPSLARRTPFFLASHFNILSYISFDQICEAKILLPFNKIMAYLDWSQIFPFDIRVSHRVTTPVYATHKTNRQANGIEPTNKRKVNVTQTRWKEKKDARNFVRYQG